MLDHMNQGRLSLQRVVDLTSAGPARIYNIAGKGRIALATTPISRSSISKPARDHQ